MNLNELSCQCGSLKVHSSCESLFASLLLWFYTVCHHTLTFWHESRSIFAYHKIYLKTWFHLIPWFFALFWFVSTHRVSINLICCGAVQLMNSHMTLAHICDTPKKLQKNSNANNKIIKSIELNEINANIFISLYFECKILARIVEYLTVDSTRRLTTWFNWILSIIIKFSTFTAHRSYAPRVIVLWELDYYMANIECLLQFNYPGSERKCVNLIR